MVSIARGRNIALGLCGALLSLVLVRAAGTAHAQIEHEHVEQANDAKLGQRVDAAIQRKWLGQFWGVVLVARDGREVLAKGYGLANDALEPIDADTLFDIGSVSKQFTAAAVLKLVEEKKLSLDDPVSTYFDGLDSSADRITLRQLLTHTSGMDDGNALQPLGFADRDAAVRKAFEGGFSAEPGEQWAYSNAGYVVLAALVEKVHGGTFEHAVRDLVFRPAGMGNTGYIDGEGLESVRATARDIDRGSGRPVRATLRASLLEPWGWGLRGAGGVATTVHDLLKWERALAEDRVLTAESKRVMWTPVQHGYAMGWFVEQTPRSTRKVHHSGSTRGYSTQLSLYPDEGVVIAVLTNQSHNPHDVEALIEKTVFGGSGVESSGVMHLGALTLEKHGGARLESARLRVEAGADGGERIVVIDRTGVKAGEFGLSREEATALGGRVLEIVSGRDGVPNRDDHKGCSVELSTGVYERTGDTLVLPEGMEWRAMPQYDGALEDGSTFTDRRVTLVLNDADRGFWPVIVWLDTASARVVAAELIGPDDEKAASTPVTPGK